MKSKTGVEKEYDPTEAAATAFLDKKTFILDYYHVHTFRIIIFLLQRIRILVFREGEAKYNKEEEEEAFKEWVYHEDWHHRTRLESN